MLKNAGYKVFEYTKTNNDLKKNKLKLLLLPITSIFSISTYTNIKKIIKKEKIDLVHCHNTFPLISPSVYYAAWSAKIPVVQTIHNFRFICANGLLYRDGKICEDCLNGKNNAVKNACYRNSKIQTAIVVAMQKIHKFIGTYKKLNYIFLTDFNRDKVTQNLKITGKIFVKPNSVEKVKIPEDIEVQKNKFIFVGRLDEYKGVDFLLEFFKKHKEYRFNIYGSGPLEEKVKAYSYENENINYFGFCPKNEFQKDLASGCAMIFSSKLYETFGLTIIEAFSIGVPVISSDIGNGAIINKNEITGVHFTIGIESSLEKSVLKAIKNRELYSKNAKESVKDYYEEKNLLELKMIYDTV